MPESRYPAGAAALTRIFQHRTLRRADGTTTSPCGFGPRSGSTGAGEGRSEERGDYVITLPAETSIELDPEEQITIDELNLPDQPVRYFRIVWTPPPGNLNLSRRYGADEVR